MQRQIIRPANSVEVTINSALVALCGGDVCAAAVLDYLDTLGAGTHLLTMQDIEAGVVIYKRGAIRAAVLFLIRERFITREVVGSIVRKQRITLDPNKVNERLMR
jgi:hypothetical protein